jgi:hypothetical protein
MKLSNFKEIFNQRIKRGLVRRYNNWKIRQAAHQVARLSPPAQGQPIALFKASTGIDDLSWNAGFHLLTSWALQMKGVPVAIFACNAGMTRCVLGTNREHPQKEPPCKSCIYQSRTLYAGTNHAHWFEYQPDARLDTSIQNLSLQDMMSFTWEQLPLGALCLPGLRWILRVHHLEDNEKTRFFYREYIRSAWNVARAFSKFLDETNPRVVLVFNGQFFPEATARYIAQQRGLRVITHEVGLQSASAFFTEGEATIYPIHIPDEFELNDEQNATLDAYLQKRFQGDFSMAGIKFWADIKGLDEGFLAKAARFKQIVPVFTNVIFDTSQPHANTVFEDMFKWLDMILETIRAHPETLFVIRAHPDETRARKESRETVQGWVEANGLEKMENAVFIAPKEYLSSYELIQRSKFVMIYNSTIGLEATLLGKPVLCAGKARFTQYPTVFFPQSVAEQKKMLEEFLSAGQIEFPAEFTRNARRFLYYQIFKSSLPFDEFLMPSVRTTQTRLKSFRLQALPESQAMRVILDGLLQDGDFLL